MIKFIQVTEAIAEFKNNKAAGNDKILIEFFKDAPEFIIDKLVLIFNLCLEHKNIPKQWKFRIIFPIFKKRDLYDLNNYRLIALLNIQYKIFSKIINNRQNII